jgi:hypothetical protein
MTLSTPAAAQILIRGLSLLMRWHRSATILLLFARATAAA